MVLAGDPAFTAHGTLVSVMQCIPDTKTSISYDGQIGYSAAPDAIGSLLNTMHMRYKPASIRSSIEYFSQFLLLNRCEPGGEDDVPSDDQIAFSFRCSSFRNWHTLVQNSCLLSRLNDLLNEIGIKTLYRRLGLSFAYTFR